MGDTLLNNGETGTSLVLDHGGNFDADPIGDCEAALLDKLLRHGFVLEHCVTELDQLAGLLQLDRILRRVLHKVQTTAAGSPCGGTW